MVETGSRSPYAAVRPGPVSAPRRGAGSAVRFGVPVFLAALLAIAAASPAPAQDAAPGDAVPGPAGRQFSSANAPGVDALESAVNSRDYRLGPGDRLALSLWGETPAAFDIIVSLQGTLIIPQIGEIPVDGLTLEEADAEVGRFLARRFRNQSYSLTLLQLRRFPVHVTGRVVQPGTVLATALDRTLDAVARALGATEDAGLRRVAIRHADGTVDHADLQRYLTTGETAHNPTLRDGDVITVPFLGPTVHLYGAVNAPGDFEHRDGDTLEDLILLGGGLTQDARTDSVEVVRYRNAVDTDRFHVVSDGTSEGFAGVAAATALTPGDQVFVRRQLDYKRRHLIDLRGEIRLPGKFAIVPGETRLSEVVERAGGFTEQAFLREATVTRRQTVRLEDKEYERLRLLSRSEMTDDEYAYFKMKSREDKGRMVVDFVALFLEGDASHDIALQNGDLIEIPHGKDFVSVLGEVGTPGNVIHRDGRTLEEYILAAGGYSERADRGKVRVIRVSSGEWVKAGKVRELNSGDTIWIPDRPQRDYWGIFRDTLAVVTQLLTVYLIVDRAIAN